MAHITSSHEKQAGLLAARELVKDKATDFSLLVWLFICVFFLKETNKKKTEHRIVICSYSTDASVEGGQCRLKITEERLE